MVDLYTALKLIGAFDDPDTILFFRRPDDTPEYMATEILSVKTAKEKYDLRRSKVSSIRPYFICEDYKGMLFTLACE